MTARADISAAGLREDAAALASRLPDLMAGARQLAASVLPGLHGRRQAGAGDEFWQFRPALPGDAWRQVDWRRSARSDSQFVRQHEWQAAQAVLFWADPGAAMRFSGAALRPEKAHRAQLLALAAAILLVGAGERVGLLGEAVPPGTGRLRLERMARALVAAGADADAADADHVPPPETLFPVGARAVFLSDFLGPLEPVARSIAAAADRGVDGVLVQILDPVEEAFPFDGRTEFRSVTGAIRHETRRARAIRAGYVARLAERKAELARLCGKAGWRWYCHHTGDAPGPALLWLYGALDGRRR